jgi:ABC-2 type transport system permease protein
MTFRPGTAVWFAHHESRLAWRDWLAMLTAGRRHRLWKVAIGVGVFMVVMHAVAYSLVGRFAAAPPDKPMLVAITASLLLSWLLMVSQAMESMTRAFYSRADLDLILASPVAAHKLFAVRIATVALAVAVMAMPLALPFIDTLVVRGGLRWIGAYGVIVAMGAAAGALAVALTVSLFRVLGPKRTRLVAQIVAAVIGAAFVIGLQAAILSYGTLSRSDVLQSDVVLAITPGVDSIFWWPARAALGEGQALVAVLALSFILLAAAIALIAPRFGDYAIAASAVANSTVSRARQPIDFRPTSPRRALRQKEWTLLRRDPWLVSQTLMQMLYLVPPALMLWRSFASGGGAFNLLVPVLVMAAGQLAGGLAWLTISGEDAPDLVATAPVPPRFVLRAKVEAVLGAIAVVFTPLVAALAVASPWHALVTGCGIVAAAVSATAAQLWFRTQAKRSQFRRRQVSSRVATFAEAFSSIAWAATAAVAAINLWLGIVPGLIALLLVAGAWLISPRERASKR